MLSTNDFAEKQILFLVTKDGQKLRFKNDNIVIADAEENIIHQSTCYRLFAVIIVGHISITDVLLQKAKKFGFAIAFMTQGFRLYQVISPFAEANVMLRRKQYLYEGLEAPKCLIKNKIITQRFNLMQIRKKEDELKEKIKETDRTLRELENADSIQAIMGFEGSVSRIYFKAYFNNVAWKGRKPRVKSDMVNALLDIGYTVLFEMIDCLLALYGFDKYCGILHRQFYMRKSLVCDVVEPFRVIIDRQVKKGINLGQFKESDFKVYDGRWCLKYEKSSEYGAVFIKEILKYKIVMFEYIKMFYRSFMKGTLDTNFPFLNPEDIV